MVVQPPQPGPRPSFSPEWRAAVWAVMVAAVFWTLLYQLAQQDPTLPEFVYVNF